MTDKTKKALLIFALFAVIIAAAAIAGKGHFYDLSLFRSGDGWGYDIAVKGNVLIHQPFMPAVEGEIPFPDKMTARKTARLVIKKMKNREIPSVTREDIRRIVGE
ncbi:MAG: DUF4907 domain-containing protein [Bacteroidales bacterium]|jgi:hypothetical protein|nr:DUF4907 domain-containing protein [Bacteroidales bacterium]MBP7037346.1 DUF4907 domain-containing protein [Bacteroidales bacterium]MDI9552233.1 DUF4907 domain-containing protein [Bacteroidota bacterium]HPB13536.1 DUF4907 domain-containing protein [Bacteroidales bacterium]